MTTSSNTLLLSLILALCSNAVLLLLVLVQIQSGGDSAPGSSGKGCDISISLDGRGSGYSAEPPRSSIDRSDRTDRSAVQNDIDRSAVQNDIDRSAVQNDAGQNLGLRGTERTTYSDPVRPQHLDSSTAKEYESSGILHTPRNNIITNEEQPTPPLPHRHRGSHNNMEGTPSKTVESQPLLWRDLHRAFLVNSELSGGFQNSDKENLLAFPTWLHQILHSYLSKDSSKSVTDFLEENMSQTTSDSLSRKDSAYNTRHARRNVHSGNVLTHSKRRILKRISNSKPKSSKDRPKPERGDINVMDVNSTEHGESAKQHVQMRKRRDVTKIDEEYQFDGTATSLLMMDEIFAAIKKRAKKKFTDPVGKILLPALIHFESLVLRHLDRLNTVMISQDFRLETLESTSLQLQRQPAAGHEPQSDVWDNKTGDDTINDVIAEDFIPVGNASLQLEGDEGSGDVNIHLQSTPPSTPMPFDNERYLEIYHGLQAARIKINALENYNLMVDTELIKTRNEVIKMDDKVTEMNRRQKNLNTRSSMQMYRVTELETFMAKTEISIHSTLDDFARMGGRLDQFKDRLKQQDNDLYAMVAQYGRHDQLMDELRSADSYKAHDLNELRNSLMSLEDRINGLYRVLDQSVDTVRNDVRAMVDALCTANRLMC